MTHIGEKIKEVLRKSSLSTTEFAEKLNTSRQNVYAIFTRRSIDTDLLKKISKILNYDFFKLYVDRSDMENLRKELEAAENEISYLKKINTLLEKKKYTEILNVTGPDKPCPPDPQQAALTTYP